MALTVLVWVRFPEVRVNTLQKLWRRAYYRATFKAFEEGVRLGRALGSLTPDDIRAVTENLKKETS